MFAPCKGFFFVVVVVFVVSSLENYFGFRTTNVRVKTDHSVSLRRSGKTFWIFSTGLYFSDNIVHSICELILCPVLRLLSPSWIKTCLYSVISSYGYFFYMPRFIYLCRIIFILVFSGAVRANACEWTTLCVLKLLSFKNFLGTLEGQQAYSRRKDYFDHFSVAQVIIVRVFFL